MMINKTTSYEQDYVYTKVGQGDIANVHIILNVGEEKIDLTIVAEELLVKAELEEILNALQITKFNKMRVDLAEECNIYLNVKEEITKVNVVRNGIRVTKLEQMGR